jgi:RND superfamily putative drug exporter
MLGRISDLTWQRPKLVLALVGAFAILAATFGRDVEKHLHTAGFTDSASESERATALLRHELGYDAEPGIVVLLRDRRGGRLDTTSPALRREVGRIAAELGRANHVGQVVNPLDDRRAARTLIARDGRSLVLTAHLSTPDLEADAGDAAKNAKRRIGTSTLDLGISGYATALGDTNEQVRTDLAAAELLAFPILAILLLIVFRGIVAAAIPLVIGVISILATLLLLRVMATFVDTSLFAQNIAVGLSLGLSIDYGLLLVSRYREELERFGPSREAHRRTVATAGRTVLFSGFTVAAALVGLAVYPQRFLYSIAVAASLAGILAAVIAVLVVPSLLALLRTRINALAIRRGPKVSDESGGWYRLASGVMRRPIAVALASSVLLLAMAAPVLSATLTGPSTELSPPGQPAREVNTQIEGSYGRGATEPVTVTVHGEMTDAQLAGLSRRIGAIDGIDGAAPFARASRTTAYANFAPAGPALSAKTQDAVREVRAIGAPGSARILVSGNSARFIDLKQSLVDHLPLVIAIVAATTLALLFMLTGSIVLPIKTLFMNTVTLAATIGVVVLAFQEGWLKGPLGYTGPPAVEVVTLAFLLAIIFGLATDYAVLVMARIKEQHDHGASNEQAVATGISRTGRVITAAAVMIAVVLGAFAVSPVFFMKQVAVGQAVGVLIDATIVRALLVPALMRLLGDWNWWAPAPLKRLQRRYGFQHA